MLAKNAYKTEITVKNKKKLNNVKCNKVVFHGTFIQRKDFAMNIYKSEYIKKSMYKQIYKSNLIYIFLFFR